LTLFEKLEEHKRNPACASCHTRIDPLGFPLERYDAVGRWRDTYSDGQPVHDTVALTDKTPVKGVDGLLALLLKQEPRLLKNFSTKLVGYALGRTVLASDQPLIQGMARRGGDAAFSSLVTDIVTSRQFRYRRDGEAGSPPPRQQSTARPGSQEINNKEGGI
jgi:hypothetical protein